MTELTEQDMKDRFEKRFDCGFDFSIGPGWFSLLADLDDELSAIDPDYKVLQVKQKYGWLMFYAYRPVDANVPGVSVNSLAMSGLPDDDPANSPAQRQFRAAIKAAEDAACHICEVCGAPGQMRSSGEWLMTRCPACAEKEHADPLEDETYRNAGSDDEF